MQINLRFEVTLVDGTKEFQDIPVDPAAVQQVIGQAMVQFASIGLLKETKLDSKVTLIPHSQIARVEVLLPTIAVASGGDLAAMEQAAKKLNKIITE